MTVSDQANKDSQSSRTKIDEEISRASRIQTLRARIKTSEPQASSNRSAMTLKADQSRQFSLIVDISPTTKSTSQCIPTPSQMPFTTRWMMNLSKGRDQRPAIWLHNPSRARATKYKSFTGRTRWDRSSTGRRPLGFHRGNRKASKPKTCMGRSSWSNISLQCRVLLRSRSKTPFSGSHRRIRRENSLSTRTQTLSSMRSPRKTFKLKMSSSNNTTRC